MVHFVLCHKQSFFYFYALARGFMIIMWSVQLYSLHLCTLGFSFLPDISCLISSILAAQGECSIWQHIGSIVHKVFVANPQCDRYQRKWLASQGVTGTQVITGTQNVCGEPTMC